MGGHGVAGVAAVEDDGGALGTRDGHGCRQPSRSGSDHVTKEVGRVVPVLPRDVLAWGWSWF